LLFSFFVGDADEKGNQEMTITQIAIAVRKAVPADLPELAGVLGRAIYDDPVMRWAIPDDERRQVILPGFFSLVAEAFLPLDEVHITEGLIGVALWVPPGKQPVGEEDAETFGRRMAEIAGGDAPRLFEVDALLAAHHPHTPNYHLQFLGVEPGWQGHGIGSALIGEVLERSDREGIPAYLEATTERSVKLYQRHGFEVIGKLVLPSGPPLWPMWRRPASPTRRG
jgi:ribosomal protein S18 acetylase RimI-like enzyme